MTRCHNVYWSFVTMSTKEILHAWVFFRAVVQRSVGWKWALSPCLKLDTCKHFALRALEEGPLFSIERHLPLKMKKLYWETERWALSLELPADDACAWASRFWNAPRSRWYTSRYSEAPSARASWDRSFPSRRSQCHRLPCSLQSLNPTKTFFSCHTCMNTHPVT